MSPLPPPDAGTGSSGAITLRLHLVGVGETPRWAAEIVDATEPPLRFGSLPELIGWLARLQWQTCGASGVR